MRTIFVFINSLLIISSLPAQESGIRDKSAVLESRSVADNGLSKLRQNENRLDSMWRKEKNWNLGFSRIDGKDTGTIELPKWAKWDYDLDRYFFSQMKYPPQLLAKNKAGYSVVMFSIDTMGLPGDINIQKSIHKDFDNEVVRLIKELPHCLPSRDENGKRMRCLYTVYVPFLPQRYRDRIIADSIEAEKLKHLWVDWQIMSKFQDGKESTIKNYIYQRLVYDPSLLGDQKQARGDYSAKIDSYGEVAEVRVLRSCGIEAWDNQVMQILKDMPRWTPYSYIGGKGEYRSSNWTVPVTFSNN